MPRSIVLVGSGAVAMHLAEALRSRGPVVEQVSPRELKGMHREAHASRFTPLPFDRTPPDWSSVSVDLLQTLDRVFSRPLPAREVIAYADRLAHMCRDRLSRIEGPAVTLFLDGPHLPSGLMFAHVAERLGHDVVTFEQTAFRSNTLRRALNPSLARFAEAVRPEPSGDGSPPSRLPRASLLTDREQNAASRAGSWASKTFVSWLGGIAIQLVLLPLPASITTRLLDHAVPDQGRASALLASIRSVARASRSRRFLARVGLKDAHLVHAGQYAFLPLHYEPERTTAPDCGRYADQVQFLADARAALDAAGHADLLVVVKEHPAQLRQPANDRTFRFRDADFYKRLLGVERVVLAHPDSHSPDLIAASRIVITPNGSAAWEALEAGRPTMTARRTWHSGCEASTILALDRTTVDGLRKVLAMDPSSVRDSVGVFLSSERLTIPALALGSEAEAEPADMAKILAEGFWARLPQLTTQA